MRKEELKQEAEEYADKYGKSNFDIWDTARFAYYQSAEPREKRIAELEHQLIHRNCLDCSNHSSKLRMRTLELEKENAELKKLKRECETSLCRAEYQYNYEQLTNAKEIIKKLKALYLSPVVTKDDVKRQDEILNEAEQFLKGE